MKLKILAICLLGMTIAKNAAAVKEPFVPTYQPVIDSFIDSYMNNDHKKLKKMLSEDATFSFNRDVHVLSYSASTLIGEMRKNQGVKQQDCHAKSKIISATDALVIAEVDISYGWTNSKQQNFLVIGKDKSGEWKINSIYKLYLTNKEEVTPASKIAV